MQHLHGLAAQIPDKWRNEMEIRDVTKDLLGRLRMMAANPDCQEWRERWELLDDVEKRYLAILCTFEVSAIAPVNLLMWGARIAGIHVGAFQVTVAGALGKLGLVKNEALVTEPT